MASIHIARKALRSSWIMLVGSATVKVTPNSDKAV